MRIWKCRGVTFFDRDVECDCYCVDGSCLEDGNPCDAIECAVIPMSDVEKVLESAKFMLDCHDLERSSFYKVIEDILKDGE